MTQVSIKMTNVFVINTFCKYLLFVWKDSIIIIEIMVVWRLLDKFFHGVHKGTKLHLLLIFFQ